MKNFEQTIEPEIQGLRTLAVYLMPDRHQAEDMVQKTLIRAYQQWETFQQNTEAGPWLRTILRFFVQSELKELRRRHVRKERYRHEWCRMITSEELVNAETANPSLHLEACKAELAPTSKQLVQMRYDQNLSCQHVAENLGKSVSWVTTTLSRVRLALKTCIEIKMTEENDVTT
jgi:RNA polymerase sigma-70 factor (ECF subfamily)